MENELRRGFHERMVALRSRVAGMAAVVVDGIGTATSALLENDHDAASGVMAADATLDNAYVEVEHEVLDLLARQAPVAGDLRFLVSTLRIAQEIERSGDLVASVARRVPRIPADALNMEIRALLYQLGSESQDMFRVATDAYVGGDTAGAAHLESRDDLIDELHRRLLRELFAIDEVRGVEPIVELGLVARFYERIADHAVVVADRVRFIHSARMRATDTDESRDR